MSPSDIEYYSRRAHAERALAAAAGRPEVAEIHLLMASLYDKIVDVDDEPQPKLRLVDVMAPRPR